MGENKINEVYKKLLKEDEKPFESKYELTDENIDIEGIKLYRIKSLKRFGSVKKGELGGIVENESNLSDIGDCWIYNEAKVYGRAYVRGNAQICDNAEVRGGRVAPMPPRICTNEDVNVSENAKVYGNAKILQGSDVQGNVKVHGNAEIYDSMLDENADIYENAKIKDSYIAGDTEIYGYTEIDG